MTPVPVLRLISMEKVFSALPFVIVWKAVPLADVVILDNTKTVDAVGEGFFGIGYAQRETSQGLFTYEEMLFDDNLLIEVSSSAASAIQLLSNHYLT